MSDDSSIVFRWKIDKLKESCDKRTKLYSASFSLSTDPTAKFALWLDGQSVHTKLSPNYLVSRSFSYSRSYSCMGVVARNVNSIKGVELLITFWLENEEGGKFYEIEEKHKFGEIDQMANFTFDSHAKDCIIFKNIYNANGSLTLCCEIKNLSIPLPTKLELPAKPQMSSSQKLWKLYETGQGTDATIVVGDKNFLILQLRTNLSYLWIHRAVFGASSDHFKNMFSSNFKEGLTKTVEIKDFAIETIEAFIKWIYLGCIDDKAVIEELFALSDKYMIEDLKYECARLLSEDLSATNAMRRLALATKYKQDDLKQNILTFTSKLAPEEILNVYQSDEWFNYLTQQRGLGN